MLRRGLSPAVVLATAGLWAAPVVAQARPPSWCVGGEATGPAAATAAVNLAATPAECRFSSRGSNSFDTQRLEALRSGRVRRPAARFDAGRALAQAVARAQRGVAATPVWVAPTCTGPDADADGRPDACDVFPADPEEQDDTDADGHGDACQGDDDGDGVIDPADAFPRLAAEQQDRDADGIGDNADPDDDADGLTDGEEVARGTSSADRDTDDDGLADGVELRVRTDPARADSDADGLPDGLELGVTAQVPRLGALAGTLFEALRPDLDPRSRTRPDRADTDGDGRPDGTEDADRNGRRTRGETDPARRNQHGGSEGRAVAVRKRAS